MPDTIPVTATLLNIRRAEIGRLLGFADVEIEISGVAFTIHGIRILRTGPASRGIAAPAFKDVSGQLTDAITLPVELASAIANVVLGNMEHR